MRRLISGDFKQFHWLIFLHSFALFRWSSSVCSWHRHMTIIFITSDPPRLRTDTMLILKCYACYRHKLSSWITLNRTQIRWVVIKIKAYIGTNIAKWICFILSSDDYDYTYIRTYISLTLYPRRGSRDLSDIAPRHPHFTKLIQLWEILQT
jgi:hypothetical protein